jgi:hypothetical protein
MESYLCAPPLPIVVVIITDMTCDCAKRVFHAQATIADMVGI